MNNFVSYDLPNKLIMLCEYFDTFIKVYLKIHFTLFFSLICMLYIYLAINKPFVKCLKDMMTEIIFTVPANMGKHIQYFTIKLCWLGD